MKEVFFRGWLKWVPFHLIFFKNADWVIIPSCVFLEKDKVNNRGFEIVFGFLCWRMSIYFHNWN